MLQFIRDRATGWIAWGIVSVICVVFAVWGIQDYISPNRSAAVAVVNGVELSQQQYQRTYRNHRRKLQRMLGSAVLSEDISDALIRRQSIENMISEEVVTQVAADDGMRISDSQLARSLRTQGVFQDANQFSQEFYDSWLRSQGYSPGTFEYFLRRSMLIEQVISGVGGSSILTNGEKDRIFSLHGQTRSYEELVLRRDRYGDPTIDGAAVQRYFDENAKSLMSTEVVDVEYVSLTANDLTNRVVVEKADLEALYEAMQMAYTTPEQRHVNHILIRLEHDADQDSENAALEKMAIIKSKLAMGEDFSHLAQLFSEDSGSSDTGGDLGYIERGDMVPEFEKTAFALTAGEISDVTRSNFGLHLIQLVDIKLDSVRSFDEVKDDVEREFRRSQAEQLYFEHVELLANLAFEIPDSLEPVAEELGLEIMQLRDVGRNGVTGHHLASDPKFSAAAFLDDVLLEGNNSDVVQLQSDTVVVLRVTEHRPTRRLKLAEAYDEILSTLKEEHLRQMAIDEGQIIISEIVGGKDRHLVARERDLLWSKYDQVTRQAAKSDSLVHDRVFSMQRPTSNNRAVYDGLPTQSGDYVVLVLLDVASSDLKTMPHDTKVRLEDQLVNDYGRIAYDAFVAGRRKEADVVIDESIFIK